MSCGQNLLQFKACPFWQIWFKRHRGRVSLTPEASWNLRNDHVLAEGSGRRLASQLRSQAASLNFWSISGTMDVTKTTCSPEVRILEVVPKIVTSKHSNIWISSTQRLMVLVVSFLLFFLKAWRFFFFSRAMQDRGKVWFLFLESSAYDNGRWRRLQVTL